MQIQLSDYVQSTGGGGFNNIMMWYRLRNHASIGIVISILDCESQT